MYLTAIRSVDLLDGCWAHLREPRLNKTRRQSCTGAADEEQRLPLGRLVGFPLGAMDGESVVFVHGVRRLPMYAPEASGAWCLTCWSAAWGR
eukprot:scaffold1070_cov245-Pinguiococcus_pyrenoidosus.AAC.9